MNATRLFVLGLLIMLLAYTAMVVVAHRVYQAERQPATVTQTQAERP